MHLYLENIVFSTGDAIYVSLSVESLCLEISILTLLLSLSTYRDETEKPFLEHRVEIT